MAGVSGPGAAGRVGRVRLDLGGRPPDLRPAGRVDARAVRGLDDARGHRGRDRAGGDRATRRVDRLPRAGDAGKTGRDGRCDLTGQADRGPRGGLEPAGVRRIRLRLRPAGVAVRGGVGDHRAAAARRADVVPRAVLRRRRLRAGPASVPGGRTADHAGLQQPADAEHRAAGRALVERLVEHLRQLGRAFRGGQGRRRRGDARRTVRRGDGCRAGHAAGWQGPADG